MAGDWIKIEHSTPDKAEVLRMAELLGISRRECLGLLVDFWRWLDANARTEFVPNLSRKCLDDVLNCPGFSAAYESVGWIEWDDKNTAARIVNFDSHHSQSAKTRAYEQKRKKKQREELSRICPENTGTREEKRREVKTLRPVAPDSFDKFWLAWPSGDRKVAKAKCLDIWKRRRLDDIAEKIISHVTAMRESKQWRDDYDPAPLTYLNQSRWEDDPATPATRVRAWQ
jgi:hypothetical protein